MKTKEDIREELVNTLVTPELYRLPSNVYVAIGDNLLPIKIRPTFGGIHFSQYQRLQQIENIREADLSCLAGQFVILEEKHFNARGRELLLELAKEGY